MARRNDPALSTPRAMSRRERQVASYAGLGHSNKQIAYALGLSTSTVASHLHNAMRKLGVSRRSDLSLIAPDPGTPDSDAW